MEQPRGQSAAVRRSNQVYFEQVCERETLACGYAYFSREHPDCPLCNFVGEVLLDASPSDPLALVDEFYASRNSRCFRWVPAETQPPEALAALLTPAGYLRRDSLCYELPPNSDRPPQRELKLLGGRAMRRMYRNLIAMRSAAFGPLGGALTQIHMERLNDPQYDAFVAFSDQAPIGAVSLLQVGEIGRICDLFIPEPRRTEGWEIELLAHTIQVARRWSMRVICAEVAADQASGREALCDAGFRERGTIAAFMQPDVPNVWHA